MELSDALRLGEYALSPLHGAWFRYHRGEEKPCAACAVGRACYAAGFTEFHRYYSALVDDEGRRLSRFFDATWPWTQGAFLKPPVTNTQYKRWLSTSSRYYNPVMVAISNLYECCGWSMSQIADWVATVEPQEDGLDETTDDCRGTGLPKSVDITASPASQDAPALNKENACPSMK